MKSLVLAIIFLIIIIGGSIATTVYIHNESESLLKDLQELESQVKSENWKEARKLFSDFKDKWEKVDHRWSMLIDHTEIDYITKDLGELQAYLDTETKSDVLAKLSSLTLFVKHIPEKEYPSLKNIF